MKKKNMKVTVIQIVFGALRTVTKELVPGLETWKLEDEWRPSKLQHYKDRPEYWEKSRKLEETWCHSNSSEKPSANAGVKNSQKSKIIMIIIIIIIIIIKMCLHWVFLWISLVIHSLSNIALSRSSIWHLVSTLSVNESFCWLAYTGLAMCWISSENDTYQVIITLPAVPSRSGSS